MKTKKEPKRCPTCGHIVENRVLHLNKTLVKALYRVWRWCEEKNRFEFERKEIAHLLLPSETMVASFGDLMYFGGLLYRPEHNKRRGHWAINRERAELFFSGKARLFTRVVIDRISNEIIEKTEPMHLKEVPDITEFLDSEFKFVPEYQPAPQKLFNH